MCQDMVSKYIYICMHCIVDLKLISGYKNDVLSSYVYRLDKLLELQCVLFALSTTESFCLHNSPAFFFFSKFVLLHYCFVMPFDVHILYSIHTTYMTLLTTYWSSYPDLLFLFFLFIFCMQRIYCSLISLGNIIVDLCYLHTFTHNHNRICLFKQTHTIIPTH